ncbi:MAG: type II toxin-antitoxin system RatA family toxin [Steroidobacteraceae bacterium]
MRTVKRTALVARPPALVYELVNDIRSYPQFVPGCTAAEVLSESAHEVVARLSVKRGVLSTHFTTRNRLKPHHSVHMHLVEGPFKQLEGDWQFHAAGAAGCKIDFTLRFQFSNALKAALFEPLFEQTMGDLLRAFVKRAQQSEPGK